MAKPNLIAVGEVPNRAELPTIDVDIADSTNPKSVINLVPAAFQRAIYNLIEKFPHYLNESEVELQGILKPSELDDRLRIAFWAEYQRAHEAGGRVMMMKNIYGSLISRTHFYTRILTNPQCMAWMMKQPESYALSDDAALHNGKNTMSKIMRMDIFDKDGNIKKTEAHLFLKAYELLENRVKGAILQRSASMHMHSKVSDQSDDDARKELEELEAKRGAIEVTVGQASDE